MRITRTLRDCLLGTTVALAPAVAPWAEAQQQATADTPAQIERPGGETATGVELFDYVEGVAGATGEVLEAEAAADRAMRAGLAHVGDLKGRAVLSAEGEMVGEIGRVIRTGDKVWAMLERGGIAGIGDAELPVQLGRLTVGPDHELWLLDVTEQQLEAAPDVDLEGARDVPPGTPLADLAE